jgi:hypothetical protein
VEIAEKKPERRDEKVVLNKNIANIKRSRSPERRRSNDRNLPSN